MSLVRLKPILFLLAGLSAPLTGWSAFEAYLKIDGIPGEATAARHEGWIEVLGVTNVIIRTASSETPELVVTSELRVLKYVDKASPKLMLACAAGTNIPSATLDFVTTNASGIRFYQIALSNVVAKSVSTAGSAGGPGAKTPEQCALTFQKISWNYTEVRPRSQLPSSYLSSYWDLLGQTGGSSSNLAVFKVTGIQKERNEALLSWQGEGDKRYQIYSGPQVDGAFSLLGQVAATSDSIITYRVPIVGRTLFFVVEEQP